MHLRFADNNTIDASIDKVLDEIMRVWKKLSVPTRAKHRVKSAVQKLYREYHMVKKNKARRSAAQIKREQSLKAEFPALLDIAPAGMFKYLLMFLFLPIFHISS